MNIFVDLKIAQILLIQVMKITLLVPNFLMPLTVIKKWGALHGPELGDCKGDY